MNITPKSEVVPTPASAMTDAELEQRINTALSNAKERGFKEASVCLGLDFTSYPTHGKPLVQRALDALAAAGYVGSRLEPRSYRVVVPLTPAAAGRDPAADLRAALKTIVALLSRDDGADAADHALDVARRALTQDGVTTGASRSEVAPHG